jgi:hypothetical protein
MNFGYVEDTAGITKPINLDDIKIINVTSDSITIRYNLTGTANIIDQLAFYIVFDNPYNMSTVDIESQLYSWLKNALVSSSPLKTSLNKALPQLEITTAGLINASGYENGTFLAAADIDAACASSPTTACIVEIKTGAPPVGTLVLEYNSNADLDPIADGDYALEISSTKYFINLNGSRITSIVVCPLLLDFIWDPNTQASGVVNDANYISFAARSDLYNYYGGTGSYDGTQSMQSCSANLKTFNDMTWPSGLVINGDLQAADGLGQLPVFAAVLSDSNVANWNSAQLYVSQDYYLDPASATWTPFNQDFWSQGFFGFGNGSTPPAPGGFNYSANNIILYNFGSQGMVFLPGGTSLVGSATFSSVQKAQFTSNGSLNSTQTC